MGARNGGQGGNPARILQISNYPPPMCGWAIQTKLVTEELRRRGHVCEVLNINENRTVKDPAYIDVQGGWDYLRKVAQYAVRGYRLNVHMNGMSKTGYLLALIAALAGRAAFQPAMISFRGGLSQDYFPRHDSRLLHHAFRILFRMAGNIACNSKEIKQAIVSYEIPPDKVTIITPFSDQYLTYTPATLASEVNEFLARRSPVFFCYLAFRPEYRLEVLHRAMQLYRRKYPGAGFIWVGFPAKELPLAQAFVQSWSRKEQAGLLLLGNVTHNEFLTILSRCSACLRTPVCDGVSASVLEALALGIPVVASENGRRPAGVITYADQDANDMCSRLEYVTEHHDQVKTGIRVDKGENNVERTADWLLGQSSRWNSRGLNWLNPALGAALCSGIAALVCVFLQNSSIKTPLPIWFLLVIVFVVFRFGSLAGTLGTISAGLIFEAFLFEPFHSLAVRSPDARNSLLWMFLGGIAFSGTVWPSPPKQR
jgi:glycosyltransferase involved in cell wall biosynthesis